MRNVARKPILLNSGSAVGVDGIHGTLISLYMFSTSVLQSPRLAPETERSG